MFQKHLGGLLGVAEVGGVWWLTWCLRTQTISTMTYNDHEYACEPSNHQIFKLQSRKTKAITLEQKKICLYVTINPTKAKTLHKAITSLYNIIHPNSSTWKPLNQRLEARANLLAKTHNPQRNDDWCRIINQTEKLITDHFTTAFFVPVRPLSHIYVAHKAPTRKEQNLENTQTHHRKKRRQICQEKKQTNKIKQTKT